MSYCVLNTCQTLLHVLEIDTTAIQLKNYKNDIRQGK